MSESASPFQGAMERLIAGAMSFREREYRGDSARMAQLAEGQSPEVLVVACADSRVDPTLICAAQPGELFTVRVVANLVPPYSADTGTGHGVRAAIEYGVKALNVSHIIVLGHAHCGGIKAVIDTVAGNAPQSEFIGPWLEMARPACHHEIPDPVTGERRPASIDNLRVHAHLVERASVLRSVEHLRGYPWIAERIAAGTLTVHGWWFDLQTGDLWVTHPETGHFLPAEGH